MSLPTRLLLHFLLTIALIWAMSIYLNAYFAVTGGWIAIVTIAALITLMNFLVRPILVLLTMPLKLFATLLAMIIVNGVFIWLTAKITAMMDVSVGTMEIRGGIVGWVVVAVVLGLENAFLREVLKHRE